MNHLENMKLRAEIKKLSAEADKLYMETRWYPIVLASALIAAVAGAAQLIKMIAS